MRRFAPIAGCAPAKNGLQLRDFSYAILAKAVWSSGEHRSRKEDFPLTAQHAHRPLRSHRCEDLSRSACFRNSIDPAGPTGKPWADCTIAATLRSPKSECVGALPCSRGLVRLLGLGSRCVWRNRGVEWEW